MNEFFLILYRFLIFPLFFLLLKFISLFNKKVKKGFLLRKKIDGKFPWLHAPAFKVNPILIHCASGEFEYTKPLVRELKLKNPEIPIVVTYFSPSYQKQIMQFEGIDFNTPLPWDTPCIQKNFLKKIHPQKIFIARTDLWPEFLNQAHKLNISTYLFSSVLSDKSPKIKNPFIRLYTRWIYQFLDHIFCVGQEDYDALIKLAPKEKISIIGDTRYDQVLFRIQNPKILKENLLISAQQSLKETPVDKPQSPLHFNPSLESPPSLKQQKKEKLPYLFVAGSTWPEDEKEILPILPQLINNNILVILAPHEPTPKTIERLSSQLTSLDLTIQLYSESSSWNPQNILLVDELGILADIYAWANWAFVGGSFKKRVHSVMEPLAQGCITFFGPYHSNNREALEFQNINNFAFAISSGKDLLQIILSFLNLSPPSKEPISHATPNTPTASLPEKSPQAPFVDFQETPIKAMSASIPSGQAFPLDFIKIEIKKEVLQRTGASKKLSERLF